MNNESYPPHHLRHLARRVGSSETSVVDRDWTGNDESARNHNEVVRLNESPLWLRLSWKENSKSPSKLIGIFELYLKELLAERYVRLEPKAENSIRLRFYHGWDNVIYIQVNNKELGLPIGRMI